MEQLAIMDYINQEVHIFNVDSDHDVDISELGFRDSDCHYMWGNNIKVVQYKEVIK